MTDFLAVINLPEESRTTARMLFSPSSIFNLAVKRPSLLLSTEISSAGPVRITRTLGRVLPETVIGDSVAQKLSMGESIMRDVGVVGDVGDVEGTTGIVWGLVVDLGTVKRIAAARMIPRPRPKRMVTIFSFIVCGII